MEAPDAITDLLNRQVAYLDTLGGFAGFLFAICGFVIVRQTNLVKDDDYIPVRAFWLVPMVAILCVAIILLGFVGTNVTMSYTQDILKLAEPCTPGDVVDCTETPLSLYRDQFRDGLQTIRFLAFVLAGCSAIAALFWLAMQFLGRPKDEKKSNA